MDEEYLKPGFDPRSLKVAQLRRVLAENEVEFPSHSKKALLVRLFEENVAPQVPELRKKYARMSSPSDEDIVKIRTRSSGRTKSGNSSDDSTDRRKSRKRRGREEGDAKDVEGDVDMEKKRPKSSRGKRRKRIGEGQHTPITEKVAKKSPHKSPRKSLMIEKFESSESSSETSSVSNKEKREASPDVIKLKVSDAFSEQLRIALNHKDEHHSDYSKPDETKTFSETVATSEDGVEDTFRSLQNEPRVRVSTPELPTSKQVQESLERVERVRKLIQEPVKVELEEPALSPQEEIRSKEESEAPEEKQVQEPEEEQEQELEEEPVEEQVQIMSGEKLKLDAFQDIFPSFPSGFLKHSLKFAALVIYNLVLFSVIVLPILFGLWYREQRILVGYCGEELAPQEFASPTWNHLQAQLPKPTCLSCPDNALCYPRMELKCRPEYALRRNSWSLYGLLPLSDSCVKDSKREKLVAEVVRKSLEFLRVKNAQVNCGECNDDIRSGIVEEELYQIFYESKAPWINDEEFDELWTKAVADLKEEPEITWRQLSEAEYRSFRDSQHNSKTNGVSWKKRYLPKAGDEIGIFRSTSKKYIGLRCKFEREVYQTCYKNRYLICASSFGAILAKIVEFKLRKLLKEREKIDKLTKKVVQKLKNAKSLGNEMPHFLSTVQLRDVLLSDVVDLKYKNHLWQQTAKRLEHNNTNIKSSLVEIHGEIMKCWEWIGPLGDDVQVKETSNS